MDQASESFYVYLEKIQPLTSKSKYQLERIAKTISLQKNQILQEIGQTCKTLYFVNEGAARIFYYKDGIEVTEYFAFENDLIIRAESLFTNKPSQKGIVCLEKTRFTSIPSQLLFDLFDTHPDLERLFRKLIENAYLETVKRIEQIQFHTAEERYKSLLENYPKLIQKIPLKHIASYLGITQVSLSRIRAAVS